MAFKSDALELANQNPNFKFLPLGGHKKPLFAWKEFYPNGFTIEECLEHENIKALGVLLGINLICVDYDGESAINYAGENNIDFTHRSWHIKRDSHKGFFRYKVLYSPTVEQIEQLPYGEFQAKHLTRDATDDSKGEALEIFANFPRYAAILGKHPSGDNYYSPKGYGFEDLTSPPKETWNFILDMAERHKQPTRSKSNLVRGNWERIIDKCPICRRSNQFICSMSKDREAIRCFHGNTFSPEKEFPNLQIGEVVHGIWAFASTQDVPETGRFSIFVRHKETNLTAIKKRLMEKNYG
mgnify:CR=1 FL=1